MEIKRQLTEVIAALIFISMLVIIMVNYYPPIRDNLPYAEYLDYGGEVKQDRYAHYDYEGLLQEVQALNMPDTVPNGSSRSIVVLNYHGTIANSSQVDQYSITIENFKDHMFALKKSGYNTITINELNMFLRGEKDLPEKSFMITFDDGIKDSYYNTDPILKALNYTGVMFVITGPSLEKKSSYYLNKEELQEMLDSGRWELQSHSYKGHGRLKIDNEGKIGPFYSNKLWLVNESRLETDDEYKKRVTYDLALSKQQLEKTFNNSVIGFALPFGDFGQRESNYYGADQILIDITKEFYNLVFYQFKPAKNKDFRANYNTEKKDFYLVMRLSADAITSSDELISQIEAAQALPLPYLEKFDNEDRWINLWGDTQSDTNNIKLSNERGTSGAMTYLDGSYVWTDYNYSLSVIDTTAQQMFLLGRFQDSENYVACKFEPHAVSVVNVRDKQKEETNKVILRGQPIEIRGANLSISISKDNVGCYFNGQKMLDTKVIHIPNYGGVGIRFENPAFVPGSNVTSSLTVKNVKILPENVNSYEWRIK